MERECTCHLGYCPICEFIAEEVKRTMEEPNPLTQLFEQFYLENALNNIPTQRFIFYFEMNVNTFWALYVLDKVGAYELYASRVTANKRELCDREHFGTLCATVGQKCFRVPLVKADLPKGKVILRRLEV